MTTTEAPPAEADKNEMNLPDLLKQINDVDEVYIDAGMSSIVAERNRLGAKKDAGERFTQEERDSLPALNDAFLKLQEAKQARDDERSAADDFLSSIPAGDDAEGDDEAGSADDESESAEAADAPAEGDAGDGGDTGQAMAASAADNPKGSVPKLGLGAINPRPDSPGSPKASDEKAAATITAGAGSRKVRDSQIDVDQLLRDMSDASKQEYGGGGQVVVASIETPRDDKRHLRSGAGADQNARVIDDTLHPRGAAITAAGGFGPTGGGAPFQVYYDVDVAGSTARPVQASLTHFTADRGGLQFRQDMDPFGGQEITASGTWTNAMDADPDNSTPKPIYDVPLLPVVQAQVRAVTQGLRLSNMSAKFDPEATRAHLQAVDICHARYAENLLMEDMYAAATATWAYSINTDLGLLRNLMEFFDKSAAYLQDISRLDEAVPLDVYLPRWLRGAIRADMTRALHTANVDWIQLTNAAIDQFLMNRNVNPTWLMEGRYGSGANGTIPGSGTGGTTIPDVPSQRYSRKTGGSSTTPGFPGSLEFLMAPKGTYVYLDGGSLDVGVIRDQNLVQKNRYVQFQETFEGVYRKGLNALRGVIPVNLRGGSAGTVSPSGLASA